MFTIPPCLQGDPWESEKGDFEEGKGLAMEDNDLYSPWKNGNLDSLFRFFFIMTARLDQLYVHVTVDKLLEKEKKEKSERSVTFFFF